MKTNVLLINPKIGEASQNKKVNQMIYITFPTSLGVLASYAMQSVAKSIEIIDEQISPLNNKLLEDIIQKLEKPKIIGISTLTLNCARAYELAQNIKMIDPDITVILGGIHSTVRPEEALSQTGVDIVVRGEGEETFKELISLINGNNNYKNILGISYLGNGKFIHNPPRPFIQNLDDIPPFPYHLFEKNLEKYPNFSGIFGSRGCPYNCTFCSSRSMSGKKYRYHSVERVIHEIKILVQKYRQKSVFFMDDNIAVNKKHFKKLCEAILKEGLNKEVYFHGSLRGDNATNEVLDMAYSANFKILYFGLETGIDRLMKIIDKGESVRDVTDAIQRASKKGFSVGTTVIFGVPTETRKDRYKTIKMVRSLPLASVRFNTLVPYPGTPVFEREYPKGNVLVKGNDRWENFGVQYMWESDDIPYVPEASNRIELIFDTMWANFAFYLSLKGIMKMLTEKFAGGNVIKLSSRWYLSPVEVKKMIDLFSYLSFRFIEVTFKSFKKN